MKTEGMSHQLVALRRSADRTGYALFMEQGTGKTWTSLADAERMYSGGKIDGVLIIAPNGVHTNWTKREIPAHLSVPAITATWHSGLGKRALAEVEEIFRPRADFEPPPLRVLSMSYDAASTKAGYAMAMRFLRATKTLLIADESSRIKNPSAMRTKNVMRLRQWAVAARILTGTPISNAPQDIFSQMQFLSPGLLETNSYRAFVAEYCDLVPADSPLMRAMIRRNPKAAFAQVIERNADGTPRYKNLDKLQRLLAPHSYRVLKEDCLDLPPKVYKNVYFELTPAARAAYKKMADEFRVQLADGTIGLTTRLAAMGKLQQITSGFMLPSAKMKAVRPDEFEEGSAGAFALDENRVMRLDEAAPRLNALKEIIDSTTGKFIIWARFTEELRLIAEVLKEKDIPFVEYRGAISRVDRDKAVDSFQSTNGAQVFLGQPQAGGIGITLTAAKTVIYYSNDFNLETRLQSEDRAHRIGTTSSVLYIDIVGNNTIDENIARALQTKEGVMSAILNVKKPHPAASAAG